MDSVTCASCVATLTNYVNFSITCDSTEEKINVYRGTQHKVLKIKLSNVLTFLGDGIWCGNVNIKEEDSLDNLKYIVNEPKVHTGVDSTTNLNNSDLSSATDEIDMNVNDISNVGTSLYDITHLPGTMEESELNTTDGIEVIKQEMSFEVVENNLDEDCVMDIKIEEIKTVTEDDDSNSVLDNKSCSSTDEPISNDSKNEGGKKKKNKRYHCRVCTFNCNKKLLFRKHVLNHLDKYVDKCPICLFKSKSVRFWSSLKKHVIGHKEIVLKSDYFTCDMCDYKTVKFSCLSNHKREHQYKSSAKPMCCFICSYKTPWRGNMVKHLKDHQNALGLYNCPCGYQEKKKKTFSRHLLSHKEILKCRMCVFKSRHKIVLIEHMILHAQVNNGNSFCCGLCEFDTESSIELTEHAGTHRDPEETHETYKCEPCLYITIKKRDLRKHIAYAHSKGKVVEDQQVCEIEDDDEVFEVEDGDVIVLN